MLTACSVGAWYYAPAFPHIKSFLYYSPDKIALSDLREADGNKNPDAAYKVGLMYFDTMQMNKAVPYLRKAAKAGHEEAYYAVRRALCARARYRAKPENRITGGNVL